MAHGKFSGEPDAKWLVNEQGADRTMQLLSLFWFKDPDKKQWDAPAGSVVDGASIPRALWTLVGSPYTGCYRRGSIVHDVACVNAGSNASKRRAADRMYYHACRAGGCSKWEATIQYLGVRIGAIWPFVDAWRVDAAATDVGPRLTHSAAERRLESDFQRCAELVLSQGETDDIKEIEARVDSALQTVVGFSSPFRKKAQRRGGA